MYADSIVAMGLEADGAAFGNGRRHEYLHVCYPFDSITDAESMGRSQSACLLFARGLLSRQQRADGGPELRRLVGLVGQLAQGKAPRTAPPKASSSTAPSAPAASSAPERTP